MRGLIDRAFGLLALALVRGFHREVEMAGLEEIRRPGPRLVVVNHFNGFVDVVVMVAALGRLPRFIGKATLRNVVIARPFLRLAGVVLVQRRVDGDGTDQNMQAFSRCHERLAAGDVVVIFPEGTTHDRETLDEVRTGAARIALSAAPAGVEGLRVIPVGITFGDKTRLRNDVLVAVGMPLALADGDDGSPAAVRALTDEIARGIEALVPGTDDPLRAWAHARAAEIAQREGTRRVDRAAALATARRTIAAPAHQRDQVERAVANYVLALDLAGIDDDAVAARDLPRITHLAGLAAATWLLAPFIGVLALVNALPLLLVVVIDRFIKVPVTKGTVRVLVAVVAFPSAWIVTAVLATDGAALIAGLVVVHAVALLVALWLVERDVNALRTIVAVHRARRAAARLPALVERRTAVRAAVADAVAAASNAF